MDCKKYIDERIGRLKNIMSEKGIDTVILKKPENVFYFSNFNPVLNSHPAVMIISLDEEPCLLVHSIRYVHACEEGKIKNVKIYGKWGGECSACNTSCRRGEDTSGEKKQKAGP